MKIHVSSFEGPLVLLLDLIEKRKLQINTVSLSEVANVFLDTVKKTTISSQDTVHFVSIIATLLYLKSYSLLPKSSLFSDDKYKDAEMLKKRVELLKYIRQNVSPTSIFVLEKRNILPKRKKIQKKRVKRFLCDETLSLNEIVDSAHVIPNFDSLKLKQIYVKATVTLEQMKDTILRTLNDVSSVSFHEIPLEKKQDTIVLFLAVLELFKQNEVEIEQKENFGILTVRK